MLILDNNFRPSVGDHVIVKTIDDYHRAKVLHNKETVSYVSLIDVGKVVSSNQIFGFPEKLKKYPPMAVLGTLQPINCKAIDLETALKKVQRNLILVLLLVKENDL